MDPFLRKLGIELPIIQAPMAGVSTSEMAAAKAAGEFGYGAQWAGQGAPLARALPAAELVARLRSEMEQALADRLPG